MPVISLQYPVPCQPSYVEKPTVEELMPFARKAVERTEGPGALGLTKPGDNYPGDYMRDYGQDPASWIKKEVENQLSATTGVPK